MKARARLGTVALVVLLAGVWFGSTRGDRALRSLTLRVDGVRRTCLVHLPADYEATRTWPLVLSLHGRLGDGAGQARLSGLNELADREGFIVAYPNGAKAWKRGWADGRGRIEVRGQEIDDVKFIRALIDRLEQDYKIDPRRVYVCGMSNGGFMSLRLACDLADRFAGAAAVASTMGADLAQRCEPTRPIPVLIVAGTEDPIVNFEGGAVDKSDFNGPILSAPGTALQWAELDGCSPEPAETNLPVKVDDGTRIVKREYPGCQGGSGVAFYEVVGGGHAWPGGEQYLSPRIIGRTSQNLDASAVIWKFFKDHPRP